MIILNKNGTAIDTVKGHLQDSKLIQLYQGLGGLNKKRILSLPVCPKCERTGLRDKGWGTNKMMCCPHCGYKGVATHQVSTYMQDKMYR